MVVIVFGLPGSGKSYFAIRLAKIIKADYINSDQVRRDIFAKRTYSKEEKELVYNAMLSKMKESLHSNRNVVLDATFHKKETRKQFVDEINGKGVGYFIEVRADENIIRERLQKERPYSEADFKIYQLISKQNEPLEEPHLLLESTNDNIDEMLRKASDFLKREDGKRTNQ